MMRIRDFIKKFIIWIIQDRNTSHVLDESSGKGTTLMKLQDFIKDAIVQIMQGINIADGELQKSSAGSIYKEGFKETMAQTLANLRIVKDNDNRPVLVIGFDVAVAVHEQTDKSDKVCAGVGVPFLSVIGFKGDIEGQSGQTQASSNTHRITFSVPVSFEAKKTTEIEGTARSRG